MPINKYVFSPIRNNSIINKMTLKATLTYTCEGVIKSVEVAYPLMAKGDKVLCIIDVPADFDCSQSGWSITNLPVVVASVLTDDEWLIIKDGSKIHKIRISDITHGNYNRNYVSVYNHSKRIGFFHSTFEAVMSRLSKSDFHQNDRSEFLARSFIVSLSIGKGGFALCKDKVKHKIAFLKKNKMEIWFQPA